MRSPTSCLSSPVMGSCTWRGIYPKGVCGGIDTFCEKSLHLDGAFDNAHVHDVERTSPRAAWMHLVAVSLYTFSQSVLAVAIAAGLLLGA